MERADDINQELSVTFSYQEQYFVLQNRPTTCDCCRQNLSDTF